MFLPLEARSHLYVLDPKLNYPAEYQSHRPHMERAIHIIGSITPL